MSLWLDGDEISIQSNGFYRPQTKFAKFMFLHVSVCPRGGGIPACLAGLQGGVSRSTPRGVSRPRPGVGGSPGPHPGGGVPSMH